MCVGPEHIAIRPSSAVVNSMLLLAASLQQLGSLLDPSRSSGRVRELIVVFADRFLERLSELSPTDKAVAAKDLVFLHILITAWETEADGTNVRLRETAAELLSARVID